MENNICVIDSIVNEKYGNVDMSKVHTFTDFASKRALNPNLSKHGTITCYIIQKIAPESNITLFPISDDAIPLDIYNILEFIYKEKKGRIVYMGFGFLKLTQNIMMLNDISSAMTKDGHILLAPSSSNIKSIIYPAHFSTVFGFRYLPRVLNKEYYNKFHQNDGNYNFIVFKDSIHPFSINIGSFKSNKKDSCIVTAETAAHIFNYIQGQPIVNMCDVSTYILKSFSNYTYDNRSTCVYEL